MGLTTNPPSCFSFLPRHPQASPAPAVTPPVMSRHSHEAQTAPYFPIQVAWLAGSRGTNRVDLPVSMSITP